MPSYPRGRRRDTYTLVLLNQNPRVFYAFYRKDYSGISGISNSDFQNLGHTVGITPPDGSLVFLRAQSPKPARVKKVINPNAGATQQVSVSTFCATNFLDQAQANSWTIVKRPRGVSLKSKRSITAIAELSNGVLYAFPLNGDDYQNNADVLGFKRISEINSAAERARLVSGSSRPRPGKASIVRSTGGEFQTFFSTANEDQLRQNGWSIDENEYL